MSDELHRRAWAKLNLTLAVGPPVEAGRPRAGHHPICSWMTCIDVVDDLSFERLAPTARSMYDIAWDDGADLGWDPAGDLVVRAHRALESAAGRELPVRLRLRKRIPAGGGLGGGSADAAAALTGLGDLFDLALTPDQLRAIAMELGSDIAFFIDEGAPVGSPARPAIVSGFGEGIERLERIDAPVVLVIPPFGCATGAVYRALDGVTRPDPALARAGEIARVGAIEPGALFNDLAGAACEVEPRLGPILTSLTRVLGCPAHLSGSGSTIFLVRDSGVAEEARVAAPGCAAVATRTV